METLHLQKYYIKKGFISLLLPNLNYWATLVSTTPDGITDYYKPIIISSANYDPFGSLMPGTSYSMDQYRYGFNGKEKDDEVTGTTGATYDYGFRIYDARIGRFLSVDPLTGKYPELTPYQFASNRPIDGIDLDGLEYCPVIPKYQYYGNGWDYPAAVDNGVINVLNLVPQLWNSGIATVQSLGNGTYLSDLGGEMKQAGASIKSQAVYEYNFAKNDPLGYVASSGKTLISPQALETAVTLYAGGKIPSKIMGAVGTTAIRTMRAVSIRFSQSSVNGLDEIVASMKRLGWSGEPIDVVKMEDNLYTTTDNTRLLAAKKAGIDVKAVIHKFDDPISEGRAQYFMPKKGGDMPKTWGEAINNRIQRQNSSFRNTYQNGSFVEPEVGTSTGTGNDFTF